MNPKDFKRLIKNFDKGNVTYDEPHFSMRCEQNGIKNGWVTDKVLDPNSNLVRIVEDRLNVYKIYIRLSKHRELKVILDIEKDLLNFRTVRILNDKFTIGTVSRR